MQLPSFEAPVYLSSYSPSLLLGRHLFLIVAMSRPARLLPCRHHTGTETWGCTVHYAWEEMILKQDFTKEKCLTKMALDNEQLE